MLDTYGWFKFVRELEDDSGMTFVAFPDSGGGEVVSLDNITFCHVLCRDTRQSISSSSGHRAKRVGCV